MEAQTSKWKLYWMSKLKKPKKEQLVVLLLFGVLLVVIALPTTTGTMGADKKDADISGTQGAAGTDTATLTYEEQLEKRLSAILSQVAGAGRVEVMVTLESRGERIVEKDTPESRKSVEETDSSGGSRTTDEQDWGEETVYYEDGSGGKSPYVVKELEPNIEGVLVLAEGGDSAVVKQELLEAVQALFPIEAHKVKIMKLEGAK
ncbi:stage III sporulation protein AG [Laedolimicola intestinihominis]|uniref:Stage III sporulation protein AG n=1 Tax=Laedolimicola intestinihominis TaxID=3133166 RepID=A0ABV1FFE4_9FIRM